ncbi:DNA-directed RNA polymerase specialized sigma24 family protein [Weissella uvarum]|uniref:RNA polymerase sigma factor n=1 Tax=Weissella uvarum TaxID=1479233 RepID=UPI001961C9D8|nr:sigma-70 family RNA polymerase sigma factor [Weissella uvarum]MBM7616745.1 DNA-directed RNA polymerase specialized sigma24 family protein [Weissella uvarum]MCM0594801.1 sigma-70 family RNA polymerase sigma factor [Weissella uvarum]
MQSKQRNQLLDKALLGDETAFCELLHEFDGLIWQQFQQQRVRQAPADWYQECRIVMHRCLTKLPQQHWGVLTMYFRQALFHHITSVWRLEYQSKFGPVLSDECLAYCPVPETSLARQTEFTELFDQVKHQLAPTQQKLLVLRFKGYTIKECAKQLHRSPSWCYQQWRLIQKYFVSLKQPD